MLRLETRSKTGENSISVKQLVPLSRCIPVDNPAARKVSGNLGNNCLGIVGNTHADIVVHDENNRIGDSGYRIRRFYFHGDNIPQLFSLSNPLFLFDKYPFVDYCVRVKIWLIYPNYWEKLEKAGFRASETDYDKKGNIRCKTFEIGRNQVAIVISKEPVKGKHPKFRVKKASGKPFRLPKDASKPIDV